MALTPFPTSAMAKRTALNDLRIALRLPVTTAGGTDLDDTDKNLARTAAAASAMIEEYASEAPQDCRDEALVRLTAWWRDSQGAERRGLDNVIPTRLTGETGQGDGVGEQVLTPAPVFSERVFRASGAMSILSMWRPWPISACEED